MSRTEHAGDRMKPPDDIVELAVVTARLSPCAKSKRGVVVFSRDDEMDAVEAIANGFNGQPYPLVCDASDRCKESCAKRCVHAEERAIRQASITHSGMSVAKLGGAPSAIIPYMRALGDLHEYEAVHVKIDVAGNLTWGGGPSCWQCSRMVLDVNLGAFWLYERELTQWKCPYTDLGSSSEPCLYCKRPAPLGNWLCMTHPGLEDARASLRRWYPTPSQDFHGIEHARLVDAVKCDCSSEKRHAGLPSVTAVWRRYTAEEFHRATMKACEL